MEQSEIDSHLYHQMHFDKDNKPIQWMNLDSCMPQTIHKNYLKLIIVLSKIDKTIKDLEESKEENSCDVELGKKRKHKPNTKSTKCKRKLIESLGKQDQTSQS